MHCAGDLRAAVEYSLPALLDDGDPSHLPPRLCRRRPPGRGLTPHPGESRRGRTPWHSGCSVDRRTIAARRVLPREVRSAVRRRRGSARHRPRALGRRLPRDVVPLRRALPARRAGHPGSTGPRLERVRRLDHRRRARHPVECASLRGRRRQESSASSSSCLSRLSATGRSTRRRSGWAPSCRAGGRATSSRRSTRSISTARRRSGTFPIGRGSSSTRPTSPRASASGSPSRTAGDYRIGLIRNPAFPVALAVTASSAFPRSCRRSSSRWNRRHSSGSRARISSTRSPIASGSS